MLRIARRDPVTQLAFDRGVGLGDEGAIWFSVDPQIAPEELKRDAIGGISERLGKRQ